ncbi:MAG: penicillin-binding transpeptidase domain-containing protein [Eubacteriales bacterium]
MQCFNLQIIQGEMFQDETTLLIQKTRTVEGTRGNIYDRNGEVIAYNELAYSITIEDNGEYELMSEKNLAINAVISELIEIVESNGDSIIDDFGIALNDKNEYEFTATSNTTRLRFIADIYGKSLISDLTEEQQDETADDIMAYLCADGTTYGYGVDTETLPKSEVLKYVTIRYQMSLNSYQKYIPTTVAQNVSAETLATVMERMSDLQGVNVAEESLRTYVDSYYYAPIIGYTGVISQDEYDSFIESGYTTYSATDIVGKTGIEKVYDTVLQGTKGEVKIYTNNLGKTLDSVTTLDATAGDDLYLTIDSDLQEVTYNVIEETLAGIIYSRLQNVLDFDRTTVADSSDIIIPIGDVYNSFFSNMILDVDHFEAETAGPTEVEILEMYSIRFEDETSQLLEYMSNPDGVAYKELSDEMQEYVSYVVNTLLRTNAKIIVSASIDTSNETYKSWVSEETINLYEYLNYLISSNCIDTTLLQSNLGDDSAYSDSTEIFNAIYAYLEETLPLNLGYEKLIYEYMIRSGELSGTKICLAAYEQGVFKYDETTYNNLVSGAVTAYDFLSEQIRTIELTAGQMGLEPCSGSAVVTDPNTGEVLALVSYPGYDTNRLSNDMDTDYYTKLSLDSSSPFYNHATMEKTAPGSTFKMVSSVAGITEGVVSPDEIIYCDGIFEKVFPNVRCWTYPNAHGQMNIVTAIANSCNSYFYELSYRLSLTNRALIGTDDGTGNTTYDYYSSDLGTDTLAKYAEMFGLGETSGIEIPEASPEISDTASVPSAIGQGTHNYTTTQLARYVSTVANKGTLYDLTLVDKVTDVDGNVVEEFDNSDSTELDEISDSTWNYIHDGMELMVQNSATFSDLDSSITIAGKTGTAQQSAYNPDHAVFVGFAPVDDPEIAISVRIANGYQSSYSAQIGKEVISYYLGALEKSDVITGEARTLTVSNSGD